MAFFDRYKKDKEVPGIPEITRAEPKPAFVVSNDNSTPGPMEGEVPPVEAPAEDFETYEDEDEGESEQVAEKDSDDETEVTDEEIEKLNTEAEAVRKRIELAKAKQLEAKQRREAEQEESSEEDNIQQPQYVSVYLSEAEFLREMMKKIQGIEQWAQHLTTYLKSREEK